LKRLFPDISELRKEVEINIAIRAVFATFSSPLTGFGVVGHSGEGRTALKCLCPCGRGGHNNIYYNPVFRGMVRQMAGF
jgi:hypothetical protein